MMTLPVSIRWATKINAPLLTELHNECYTQADMTPDLMLNNILGRHSVVKLAEWLPSAQVDVDDYYQHVAGYIHYHIYRDVTWLKHLAVRPSCQRRGVGRALLMHMRRPVMAKNKRPLLASVCDKDQAANDFLRALGFKAVGFDRSVHGRSDGFYVFELQTIS